MIRFLIAFCVCVFVAQITASNSFGFQELAEAKQNNVDDEKSDEKDEKKKEIETVEIEVKPIKVFESFDGRFESIQTHEVKTDLESWSDLEILNVVEEGSAVSKGQAVIEFNPEELDKAIAEAEFAVRNAEFDLSDAKLAMQEVTKTFELDSAIAERNFTNAREDFDYYKKVTAPERLKDLAYDEKSAGYSLEYSKDELDQLEQMYTEDELTEESEEIVLKRARRSVERAERSMNRAMLRIDRARTMEIPREDLQKDDDLKRAALEFEKSQITLPTKKQRIEIALAKSEFELANKKEKLDELLKDREKMTLKSAAEGIVYYGRCVRGVWKSANGSSNRQLEIGKKIPADKVVMTIVDVNKLLIRADLNEANVGIVTPRLRGKALIKAAGDWVIPVTVKSVSKIPIDNGKFDCEIIPESLENVDVMPGMTCKMSFLVYENKRALVAPRKSVFSDDEGISHYVYIVDGEDTKRRDVKAGKTSGDDIEILDGLTAGEKIAKEKP